MAKSETKKWMAQLMKLQGAVDKTYDPFQHVVRSPSPSLNFTFGRTHGLPKGYSLALYGPPKHGKSIVTHGFVGQLHQDDPDAFALKFNTEMREGLQMSAKDLPMYGIDPDRYVGIDTNLPTGVFDQIEKDVCSMIDDGMPIKMVIIDSVSGIRGRRGINAETVDQQMIGDHALTIKDGLARILEVVRRKKIALILTTQVVAELDQNAARREGKAYKMGGAYALKHFAEYFMLVEKNESKEGRQDLLGNDLANENLTDMMDKKELTGHKIRVCMKDSSAGSKGRVGEFTFDYKRGFVSHHEEVFRLAVNRGIFERPNNTTYIFQGRKYVGRATALEAIEKSAEMQAEILKELKRRDLEGNLVQVSTEEGDTEGQAEDIINS